MQRLWNRSLLGAIVKKSGIFYTSPSNFNYWYNFGFLALLFLAVQIISGIFLAMFYNANTLLAFGTLIGLNNEVYFGWWLRYLHSNGASFFFFFVYIHIFKGFYFGSFSHPRQTLWFSGILIWLLMIATAFLGYVLPWGQMSFWAAVVITSLLGAIPVIGQEILFLLWGGFAIDNVTTHRFFSLHYTLPFVILALAILHLFFLHEFGSSNPLGLVSKLDNIPFFPYYMLKDFLSILFVFVFFVLLVTLSPDLLGHSDNYIEADPLVTPSHIVPEWYFLPLYAVLRSVTDKLLGLTLIGCFVVCLFCVPILLKSISFRSSYFKLVFSFFSWCLFFVYILLGWIGGLHVIEPFITLGQFLTFFYFFLLLVIFPLLNFLERFFFYFFLVSNLSVFSKVVNLRARFTNLCL